MRKPLIAFALLCVLAACGRDTPPPGTPQAAAQDAEARIGDVAVHASLVQTSALDASVAKQYDLERSDRSAMLLLSVRRDGDAPLPASLKLDARASDASGASARPVALRRVVVDGLVDYVGTIDVAPPERLRVDVTVAYDNATSELRITRDLYPR
jgi:hypothetical protein